MICPSCQAENDDGATVCFDCRAVLEAVTRGSLIAGRYEVLSALGRGGMGSVYRAHDRVLDEEVAVKVLRHDLVDTPEAERRFRSEIKLARTVSHWNVCRIHEYGEQDGPRYISMELVRGETLKELVRRRGALPPHEALEVAIQIADGLEAIHKAGIVHRDLTSSNVTRDQGGRVRVMDFGIAKRVAAEEAPAVSGYVVGNPEYMSPEQARGRGVDFRSDLYSFGIVLFEMLTGKLPFHGDSPVATLLLHLEAPPPLDTAEAAALPASLLAVLRRALAKEPGERYQTARELGEALHAASAALVAGGRPLARRLRAPALLLASVAVLAALAVLVTRGRPVPVRPNSTTSLAPAPPPPSVTALAEPAETPSPTTKTPVAAPHRPPAQRPTMSPPAESPPASLAAPPTAPTSSLPPPTEAEQTGAASPAPLKDGFLTVAVQPWADVSVDGTSVGQTPIGGLRLSAGAHDVLLSHPDYLPYRRRVTIRPGENLRLVVPLPSEGVRRH
jgi:serine/threonine-protein kinase